MTACLSRIAAAVGRRKLAWAATFLGFVSGYYLGLLGAAMARFGQAPNYVNLLDWPRNVRRILDGTPSLADTWRIIGDEWIVDIGRMNYDYGNGVAEWAMTIITDKLGIILGLGALVATAFVLVLQVRPAPPIRESRLAGTSVAIAGATLVGVGNATLHWAVACATPSWVASLAMLGMSPGLALWLEPIGDYITVVGFLFLLLALGLLAQQRPASRSRSTLSDEAPHHA